jgi:hypothetical protein
VTNNLENKKFGRLTPLHIVEIPKYTKGPVWLFKCDCGKEKEILYRSVIKGDTKTCGCLRRELMKDNKLGKYCIKHGMSRTRYYRIWVDMKSRCLNNLHESFAHYGGRGIKVCEEWDNFTGFMEDTYKSYLEHIEEHGKRETTLERKNVD